MRWAAYSDLRMRQNRIEAGVVLAVGLSPRWLHDESRQRARWNEEKFGEKARYLRYSDLRIREN